MHMHPKYTLISRLLDVTRYAHASKKYTDITIIQTFTQMLHSIVRLESELCVCVRERERQRGTERARRTHKERERERELKESWGRQSFRAWEGPGASEREREKEKERERAGEFVCVCACVCVCLRGSSVRICLHVFMYGRVVSSHLAVVFTTTGQPAHFFQSCITFDLHTRTSVFTCIKPSLFELHMKD